MYTRFVFNIPNKLLIHNPLDNLDNTETVSNIAQLCN